MNADDAIAFFELHQPMPPDTSLTEELIRNYDEARQQLERHPDPRGLTAILNSFGDGDGFGVYPLVADTLRAYPRDEVVRALAQSLRSPVPSVRAWSMDVAQEYVDPMLVVPALELLAEQDRDMRVFAAYFLTALEAPSSVVVGAMRNALRREDDDEIKSVIHDWLQKAVENS